MSDVKVPLIVVAGPNRYRPLAIFWTIVAAVLVGGAATLELMGPPKDIAGPEVAARAAAVAAAPKPAVAAPSRPDIIAAPDPALQEPAPDFAGRTLPIKGPDGRLPMAVYKAPFDASDKHPKVVLIIDGVGKEKEISERVLDELPGAVDIAFSAYMPDNYAADMTAEARKTGHECLLSIPMEPNAFPMEDEGWRQLSDRNDAAMNKQDLEFALSRLPGCVGATGASDGMSGEHFAQDGGGLSDVLEEVDMRGLLYLDPRTGAPALEVAKSEYPISVVDVVIDAPTTSAENSTQPASAEIIDQRLAALEQLALKNGTAIGLAGPPQPMLLDRIALWTHQLAAHNLTLAPLTAVQRIPKVTGEDAH